MPVPVDYYLSFWKSKNGEAELHHGHVIDRLKGLSSGSVHCCAVECLVLHY
jgi:hypothetical protein